MRHYLSLISLLGVCLCWFSPAANADSAFIGNWRINQTETDKVRIEYKDGSGVKGLNGINTSVTIGGLPLPSRIKQGPLSGLAAKDPQVLRCTNMRIDVGAKKLTLVYDEADKETLVKGDHRGRTSSWSKKKIQQRYKTTERVVTKTWTVRPDGRLEVAVKLNPKGDKSRTLKRVFDRVTASTADHTDPSE